jgi:hypothetical protein
MTTIADTVLGRLESEGRLFNSVLKGATRRPGRVAFRGDIALRLAAKRADEARPPEISTDQIVAAAHEGETHLAFLAGFLLSFDYIPLLAETLGDMLSPQGKYFLFVDNIDISKKYVLDYAGATFYILPIDESTVWNEMLQLLYIEKNDIKKLDTAGKTDAMTDKALLFKDSFPSITYEDGVKSMGPIRNIYENRPV